MKLPRRVPWASISELDQICSWIYTDENDLDAKVSALHRLAAWKATTSLPHALESAQHLQAVILQDKTESATLTYLSLRQAYAAAIIRLVNGLVDPLQFGVYARSIASIAAQLGLPSWLVELRHAATHEDLPSLDLLREAARESMQWLFHNYFLPTLNPSSVPQSRATSLRALAPLLKQYKTLSKITTRDLSLGTRYKLQAASFLRDIERWLAEAKVAADVFMAGLGWDVEPQYTDAVDADLKELWALERLCDGLVEKGALVPLSKKKRNFPVNSFFPPPFSVALWQPLLEHLNSHHPDLPRVLTHRIISQLSSQSRSPSDPGHALPGELSYDMCVARWAMWAIHTWNFVDPNSNLDLRREAVVALVTALGPEDTNPTTPAHHKAAFALLRALTKGVSDLEIAVNNLLPTINSSSSAHVRLRASLNWSGELDVVIMNERLAALCGETLPEREDYPGGETPGSAAEARQIAITDDPKAVAPGWRLLDGRSGWKPTPIGVHYSAER